MKDLINHPNHYTQGIECWDYITSHKMGYLEGNIIKYVTRYKHKDGLDDLLKAKAYLQRLIEEQFGPSIMGESPVTAPLADIRTLDCVLDGRNCTGHHPHPHFDELQVHCCLPENEWPSKKECARPFDIKGELSPEDAAEIHGPACGIVILPEGQTPDEYFLGDFRRGGPGANWMKKPCRYDPND